SGGSEGACVRTPILLLASLCFALTAPSQVLDLQPRPLSRLTEVSALERKAESNDTDAEWRLGVIAENSGQFTDAARWYRRAAELGSPLAENDYGVLFFHGRGVPQDYSEALRWF